MTHRGLLVNKHARWPCRGPDYKRSTETSSEFESQVKTKRYTVYRERKGVIKIKNSHWLSSLRGRLRQAHGPSSENQRRRPGEFGHSRRDSRLIQVSDSL